MPFMTDVVWLETTQQLGFGRVLQWLTTSSGGHIFCLLGSCTCCPRCQACTCNASKCIVNDSSWSGVCWGSLRFKYCRLPLCVQHSLLVRCSCPGHISGQSVPLKPATLQSKASQVAFGMVGAALWPAIRSPPPAGDGVSQQVGGVIV